LLGLLTDFYYNILIQHNGMDHINLNGLFVFRRYLNWASKFGAGELHFFLTSESYVDFLKVFIRKH